MNISGNFNTEEREIFIVKQILEKNNIPYKEVSKLPEADDGDVKIVFQNGIEKIIEIKEEKFERFIKFGDYGIDFISVFHFKSDVAKKRWKGRLCKPSEFKEFYKNENIIVQKEGKISYSKSDLWLFYVMNRDEIYHYSFFDGEFMTSKEFKLFCSEKCQFACNSKNEKQVSHRDTYESAVFFINNKNEVLLKNKVDIKNLI